MTSSNVAQGFHVLAKPSGAACNLDCKYCFFLSKEILYPESTFRMTDEVLELYVRQLIEAHPGPEVNISWQGGEPTLMGLEFFKRSVQYAKNYGKAGQRITYSMQTNGTLINDEWCEFFKENNFLIGLSIDGPREFHDAYRVSSDGSGSFNRVMRGWESLHRNEVDFNILCTINSANADNPLDVYHFLRDEIGAQFIQFIPVVERVTEEALTLANPGWSGQVGGNRIFYAQRGNKVTRRSVSPEQLGRFYIDIFEEWVRRDVGKIYVQMFDTTLASWMGVQSVCVFAPTCGMGPVLEHNGDLYSCDHFVETPYLLGNIRETHISEMINSKQQRKFGNDKKDTLPCFCSQCDVKFACNGGCPKDRFITTPDGEAGLNYLCAGYKAFFKHTEQAMRKMANLLRGGHPPAEIMSWYSGEDMRMQSAFEKAGRNDLCPCGSGKKFKRCHGRI